MDFFWEVAGVRNEYAGEFAHETFLQKQDADLQWIRNAMRAVSLQLAIHPCGNFDVGFPFVFANWVGDDHPVNGSGQMFYYRQRLHRLKHKMHVRNGSTACCCSADWYWRWFSQSTWP